MTKKEFDEFLNAYGKDYGEFTEDELYEIGCKYKELPVSEKDWNWLVSKLGPLNTSGEVKTGESFRTWVKGRQYADGTIKTNVRLISGQTVDDMSFKDFEQKTEEIKQDLYKQQIKTRDSLNAYRRVLRNEARLEDFKDLMRECVADISKMPTVHYQGAMANYSNEAVLLLSDLHIGMEIENFYNKYNVDIARKRINKLVDDTIEFCVDNKISRLNICNLGDAVAGLIHTNARLEQEIDVVQQIMTASEIIADMLNKLQAAAPEVIYRSCTDNHSRAMASLQESIECENFGKLIDFYLKARLENSNIQFVNDGIDQEIGMFELLNGKKLLFAHGHHDNVNSVFQNYVGATKQFIDYICLGHYHTSKIKSFEGCKVFINGCVCGQDPYAFSKRLFGEPEQTLIMFKNDNLSVNYISLNIQ